MLYGRAAYASWSGIPEAGPMVWNALYLDTDNVRHVLKEKRTVLLDESSSLFYMPHLSWKYLKKVVSSIAQLITERALPEVGN